MEKIQAVKVAEFFIRATRLFIFAANTTDPNEQVVRKQVGLNLVLPHHVVHLHKQGQCKQATGEVTAEQALLCRKWHVLGQRTHPQRFVYQHQHWYHAWYHYRHKQNHSLYEFWFVKT